MIGQRIQKLRQERHLSISTLAKKASVAKSYLSAIERDIQVNPSIHVIQRISSVLEVPVQFLLQAEPVASEDEA